MTAVGYIISKDCKNTVTNQCLSEPMTIAKSMLDKKQLKNITYRSSNRVD